MPDPLAPVDPTTLVDGVPDGTVVIDLASSLAYRRHGHLPGAYWAVRSRLAEARAATGDAERAIVTRPDGALAALAAGEVATRWPNASVSGSPAAPERGSQSAAHPSSDSPDPPPRSTTSGTSPTTTMTMSPSNTCRTTSRGRSRSSNSSRDSTVSFEPL
ncbi:MAG: hypothetical protein R2710_00665 [Acidimicrobiales bacterium]